MAQDKVVCPSCGSTFFNVYRAEQFLSGGYGTAEFRSVTNTPKTVLVCIGCSTPVTPKPGFHAKGSLSDLAEQEFRKSIESGQKYKKDNSIQNIAQTTASVQEVEALRKVVANLLVELEELKNTKVAPRAKKKAEALVTAS